MTRSAMMSISGSVRRKAMVDLRCTNVRNAARRRTTGSRGVPTADTSDTSIALLLPRERSGAHEAFELGSSPADRFVHRLSALRVLGYELGRDRLRVDLSADLGRCR